LLEMAFTQIGGGIKPGWRIFRMQFAFHYCFTLHLHLLFGLLTIFLLRYDVIFGRALSLHRVAGSFLLERSGLETSYCTGVTQALAVFLFLHYLFLCSYSPNHPRFSLVSFSCNFPRNILDPSIYQLFGLSEYINHLCLIPFLYDNIF